jgi:hypothetical protein
MRVPHREFFIAVQRHVLLEVQRLSDFDNERVGLFVSET